MRHLLVFIFFAIYGAAWSQPVSVDPHTFPLENNPTNSNFEFYSRATGTNKRATFDNVRKNMLPSIVATPISYTPTATGNANNRGQFVTAPNGNKYFIDGNGASTLIMVSAAFVTGTGTANYLPKWVSASVVANSLLYDNGVSVGIGTSSPTATLDVAGVIRGSILWGNLQSYYAETLKINEGGYNVSIVPNSGYVGIGNATPDSKLDIGGDLEVSTRTGAAVSVGGWTSGNRSADIILGSGLSLSNGTLSASGGVSSVGLSLPSIFNVTGSPVTGSGTLSGSLADQNANMIFAGPASGAASSPTFRALTAADISGIGAVIGTGTANYLPKWVSSAGLGISQLFDNGTNVGIGTSTPSVKLDVVGQLKVSTLSTLPTSIAGWNSGIASQVTLGSNLSLASGTLSAAGSVSSVGLSLPSIFTVSGSPVTGSGTLSGTLATQSANTVFAGPSSGAAAAPTFRTLTGSDLTAMGGNTGTGTANWVTKWTGTNTVGNSQIYDNGTNVGIGTASVGNKLTVATSFSAGLGQYGIVLSNAGPEFKIGVTGAGADMQSFGAPLYIQQLGNNCYINPTNGLVGIGTTSPTEKLTVNGTVKATNFWGDFQSFNSATLTINKLGNNVTLCETSGLVGVGNASPDSKLDITGDLEVSTRTGAATYVGGWTAGNRATNVTIGAGLSLTSGTLSAALSGTALTNGKILVGNASNVATEVTVSGDATLSNTGDLQIAANAIGQAEIATGGVASAEIMDNSIISEDILDGGISSVDIANGTIIAADLSSMSATTNQQLTWNGSSWAPATTKDTVYINLNVYSYTETWQQSSGNINKGFPYRVPPNLAGYTIRSVTYAAGFPGGGSGLSQSIQLRRTTTGGVNTDINTVTFATGDSYQTSTTTTLQLNQADQLRANFLAGSFTSGTEPAGLTIIIMATK